jgi:hypothetical protein
MAFFKQKMAKFLIKKAKIRQPRAWNLVRLMGSILKKKTNDIIKRLSGLTTSL